MGSECRACIYFGFDRSMVHDHTPFYFNPSHTVHNFQESVKKQRRHSAPPQIPISIKNYKSTTRAASANIKENPTLVKCCSLYRRMHVCNPASRHYKEWQLHSMMRYHQIFIYQISANWRHTLLYAHTHTHLFFSRTKFPHHHCCAKSVKTSSFHCTIKLTIGQLTIVTEARARRRNGTAMKDDSADKLVK